MKNIRVHSFAVVSTLAIALLTSSTRVDFAHAAQDPKPSDAPAGNAENGKLLFA